MEFTYIRDIINVVEYTFKVKLLRVTIGSVDKLLTLPEPKGEENYDFFKSQLQRQTNS